MNPKKSFLVVRIVLVLLIAVAVSVVFIQKVGAARRKSPLSLEPLKILENSGRFSRFGDFEFFVWDKLDNVIIFDTQNYAVQSRFFKKLAFFIEKAGYAGEFHTDEELKWKQGYRAHNYSAEYLALYFNTAAKEHLNDEELILLDILRTNHILLDDEEEYLPVQGGVISISRESNYILRNFLLVHELLHGFYYYFPEYRRGVEKLWAQIPEVEREFWLLFLDAYNYDITNKEIVVNEFHAYLLQQPESGVYSGLYGTMLGHIQTRHPEKAAFARNFPALCPECLLKSRARIVDLMIRVGEGGGFNYYAYFESMKLQ